MTHDAPRPPTLEPGFVVAGKYRILGLLGQGGMASVFAARDVASGATVALKVLLPELAQVSESVARFRREASMGILLDHPHLVKVFDVGAFESGGLFLAMEVVHGPSLGDLIDAGALGARRSLVLARQVLDALAYGHAFGIVHRDLKPDNVMVVTAGELGRTYEVVKVCDLGLVKLLGDAAEAMGAEKLTRTGIVFGTPAYMAPEQALGRAVDGRADLYALGVILFEALTGRRPFPGNDPMNVMRRHISEPPPALASAMGGKVTPALEDLVARALRKRPEERFPDAAAMTAALDAAFLSLEG
jgi:eukaryotic-like serine/threonine-protein kinase